MIELSYLTTIFADDSKVTIQTKLNATNLNIKYRRHKISA